MTARRTLLLCVLCALTAAAPRPAAAQVLGVRLVVAGDVAQPLQVPRQVPVPVSTALLGGDSADRSGETVLAATPLAVDIHRRTRPREAP